MSRFEGEAGLVAHCWSHGAVLEVVLRVWVHRHLKRMCCWNQSQVCFWGAWVVEMHALSLLCPLGFCLVMTLNLGCLGHIAPLQGKNWKGGRVGKKWAGSTVGVHVEGLGSVVCGVGHGFGQGGSE